MTADQFGLHRRATLSEYFAVAERSVEKLECRDGRIVHIPGGTPMHALITFKVGLALGNRLAGGPCEAFSPDLRIGVPRKTHTMYPDLSVVCGPLEYDDRDPTRQTILNPRLVVEVLSPSTEAYDRGRKFERYMDVSALQEYVLVTQDRPRVESLFRQADGTWSFAHATGLSATLRLRSLSVDLPLAEAYAGVTFPPAEDGGIEDVAP